MTEPREAGRPVAAVAPVPRLPAPEAHPMTGPVLLEGVAEERAKLRGPVHPSSAPEWALEGRRPGEVAIPRSARARTRRPAPVR
jgi:hypothetical protein